MTEIIEVLDNPRKTKAVKAEMAAAYRRGKAAQKGGGGKKKKGGRSKRRNLTLDPAMFMAGALVGAVVNSMLTETTPYAAVQKLAGSIPEQAKRFIGAMLAAAGYVLWSGEKKQRKMKSFYAGLLGSGIAVQVTSELKRMYVAAGASAIEKIAETAPATSGFGSWPPGPEMSAADAAYALGMQSRVPYNPYGLSALELNYQGDFGRAGGGLGALVYGDAPLSPALNPDLNPAGLGAMDGQFGWASWS